MKMVNLIDDDLEKSSSDEYGSKTKAGNETESDDEKDNYKSDE